MRDIELGPHEYREKPIRRHPLAGPAFTRWGIACGIWAGCVIGIHRYWITGDNPWIVAAISLGPAAIWGFLLIRADRD